jgi:hypothetical protein
MSAMVLNLFDLKRWTYLGAALWSLNQSDSLCATPFNLLHDPNIRAKRQSSLQCNSAEQNFLTRAPPRHEFDSYEDCP